MREVLFTAVLLALLLVGWAAWPRLRLRAAAPSASAARPARSVGPAIAGWVLVAPRRLLCLTQGAHVAKVLFSDGQTVRAGDALLKLTVGSLHQSRLAFATAPAAGEVVGLDLSAGLYLAAGVPYARLAESSPVRVQVPAAAAASLSPGDSLLVVAGPPGLANRVGCLQRIVPGHAGPAPAATVWLVLTRLRWPPPATARVVLAPVRSALPTH